MDLGTTTPAYLVPGPRLVKCEHYCLIKECLSVSLRSQHDSYVPGGVGGQRSTQFGKKLIWLTLGPGQIPSMMNCVSHIMVENLVMISDRTEN